MDAPAGLQRRSRQRASLCRLPLPLLDGGRQGHGQEDRRADGEHAIARQRRCSEVEVVGNQRRGGASRTGLGTGPGISILGGGSLGLSIAPASFAAWNVVPGEAPMRSAPGPISYQITSPPTAARPIAAVTSTGQWRCSGGFRRDMHNKAQEAELVPCAVLRRAR